MTTEKEDLESKLLGHHLIYGSLATLFLTGSVMAGIGAYEIKEHAALLAVACGYSAMIGGLTFVWWYKDITGQRQRMLEQLSYSKPL